MLIALKEIKGFYLYIKKDKPVPNFLFLKEIHQHRKENCPCQTISWWFLIQMQPNLKLEHHNTDTHNFSTAPYKIFNSTSLEQVIFYPTVIVQHWTSAKWKGTEGRLRGGLCEIFVTADTKWTNYRNLS